MLNFTVGPVQYEEDIRVLGAEQTAYFRTPEFSKIVLENEVLIKKLACAGKGARAVFLTGSGTAGMETAVMNTFDTSDKVLVVNGGSFGGRFVEICKVHRIPYTEIKLEYGQALAASELEEYEGAGFTGFLVNVHETSTGVLYDMHLIHSFCARNHLFLVADAVSSFLADPFHMADLEVDIMITASQKALACPPGICILVLSSAALQRLEKRQVRSLYFDLKKALEDGCRGQTPYTPAVTILKQINKRLTSINLIGKEAETKRIAGLAQDFRSRIAELPLRIPSNSLSNALTPLEPIYVSAYSIFVHLKDEYGIWVCPNGGELSDRIFRVGHLGALTVEDNMKLADALYDLKIRGLL